MIINISDRQRAISFDILIILAFGMLAYIHIYFFIIGALFFYILLYCTQIVPRFISIWGTLATKLLFIVAMIKLFGFNMSILKVLLIPLVLNEFF